MGWRHDAEWSSNNNMESRKLGWETDEVGGACNADGGRWTSEERIGAKSAFKMGILHKEGC